MALANMNGVIIGGSHIRVGWGKPTYQLDRDRQQARLNTISYRSNLFPTTDLPPQYRFDYGYNDDFSPGQVLNQRRRGGSV